jgi:hypothetical protein
VKVATKYKANKKLLILGVTGENAKKKADTHKFMKKHGATWKVAMAARKSMGAYKIKFYPTTIVVDHNGKVFWHSFMANVYWFNPNWNFSYSELKYTQAHV